jgi:hypothetical protein
MAGVAELKLVPLRLRVLGNRQSKGRLGVGKDVLASQTRRTAGEGQYDKNSGQSGGQARDRNGTDGQVHGFPFVDAKRAGHKQASHEFVDPGLAGVAVKDSPRLGAQAATGRGQHPKPAFCHKDFTES